MSKGKGKGKTKEKDETKKKDDDVELLNELLKNREDIGDAMKPVFQDMETRSRGLGMGDIKEK